MFQEGLERNLNDIFMLLVPNGRCGELKHFRPIGLVEVCTIANFLALRIINVISKITLKSQNAFVEDHHIWMQHS